MLKTILAFFVFGLAVRVNSQDSDVRFYYESSKPKQNCIPEMKFNPEIHENVTVIPDGSAASFSWPMETPLNNGCVIVNYVDDNPQSGITDYDGDDWAYNGHNGTDICLHDFRSMDRCVGVYAAEAGRVVEIAYNHDDRNTSWVGQPANIVGIRHDDGSYGYYYHLMKRSVTVKVGEFVPKGRLMGFVGSSGNSTDAHLHFEVGYFTNGNWNKRDPWNGSYNTLPGMWDNQPAHANNTDFLAMDMGVYVAASVGGDVQTHTDYAKLKERIIDPVTVSGYEPKLGVWLQFQGTWNSRQVKYEIRRPNGTLFDDAYFNLFNQYQYAWSWWTPPFNPGIGETGNWYARVLLDGVEKKRVYFNVQLLTSTRPRLYPTAGKCFRRSIFVQRDTLRVRPVRTGMEYQLLSAPSNVTLTNDSIVNIGPDFTQSYRTREFKVIASMGGSSTLRDTMIYKLIDTAKQNITGNGIASLDLNVLPEGRWSGSSLDGDTVTVQLRTQSWPYLVVDEDRFLLNSNGYGIANFPGATGGSSYFIVVRHRNSIETWSKTTQQFQSGFPIAYDFTTSRTKAYGDNMKFKSGKYCIYSGDVNQDGTIDVIDLSMIDNDVSFFFSGYVVTDLDGDNFVDIADLTIADNNAYNFVSRVRP